ncbi:MAG: U32 family peptidase, partial [Muribaculaceae bacterium]|nr:U32 family peptidase [Muribaculaceae bacterium]
LYHIGVDALIVQDMGILRMNIPPIALHASTQCDTRDAAKAHFLEEVGFSQIVLARELSLDEIREIHSQVKVPLEAFVHGALCVSYSGDCHASWALKGRSANRGECAQICRLPWRLTDAQGHLINTPQGEHLLSLRDMNRSDSIEEMLEAGISSFKIEGRLKDIDYVKNVVTFYRRRIDEIIARNPEKYCRQSLGVSNIDLKPDLSRSFNRGYTDYFLHGNPSKGIASTASPKSIGERVGRVVSTKGGVIVATLTSKLTNGDGLGYFSKDGVFHGFRLNRVDGTKLYPAGDVNIAPGTILWRNRNKSWDDAMQRATPERTIPITMELRAAKTDTIALDISYRRVDGTSATVTTTLQQEYTEAKTPQEAQRLRVLGKLGDTIFKLENFNDLLGDRFIPASTLTQLRRNGIELLNRTINITHPYSYRRKENSDAPLPHGTNITYHDNVANRLARQFYAEHGATSIEPALETQKGSIDNTRIMTTRYCL